MAAEVWFWRRSGVMRYCSLGLAAIRLVQIQLVGFLNGRRAGRLAGSRLYARAAAGYLNAWGG